MRGHPVQLDKTSGEGTSPRGNPVQVRKPHPSHRRLCMGRGEGGCRDSRVASNGGQRHRCIAMRAGSPLPRRKREEEVEHVTCAPGSQPPPLRPLLPMREVWRERCASSLFALPIPLSAPPSARAVGEVDCTPPTLALTLSPARCTCKLFPSLMEFAYTSTGRSRRRRAAGAHLQRNSSYIHYHTGHTYTHAHTHTEA